MISVKYTSVSVSPAVYGLIASGYYSLPSNVSVESATASSDGSTVTLILTGTGLGSWALPTAVAGALSVNSDKSLTIAAAS